MSVTVARTHGRAGARCLFVGWFEIGAETAKDADFVEVSN